MNRVSPDRESLDHVCEAVQTLQKAKLKFSRKIISNCQTKENQYRLFIMVVSQL